MTEHGYLAAWAIQPTVDGREFKLVATHGDKFYRDQKLRAAPAAGAIEGAPVPLLKALTDRGINEVQGNRLLRSLPADQPIADQLEYGDYLIWKSRATIKNAPGFYVYLLRQNILPPEDFETSSRKETRRANEERDAQETRRRILLEDEYHEYCRGEGARASGEFGEEAQKALLAEKMRTVRRQWGHLPAATIEELATRQLESDLRAKLDLLSFERVYRPQSAGAAIRLSESRIQRTASLKSARAVVRRQVRRRSHMDRAASLGFTGGHIAGRIADQKRPRGGNMQFAQGALHHPTRGLAARALLGRAMRAVIDLCDAHPERRELAKELLIDGN